ncbi:hypothetical protein QT327_10740 [Olivibacter sp. 47]|uniref:hypothetical protein n=1 Tax=Olivibacter sp. 47 TaxID=3056486 RepID=UPI0025A3A093|nr:hypothetical protein [Olivibacter sp. 47]MDM8174827.1 hypothetical protein [Olivibacter sp. 47]
MPAKSFRKQSRVDWGRNLPDTENLTNEELKLGAILRIADSMEIMCKDRLKLESDLKYYKEVYSERGDRISQLEKRLATYKGHVTRLKNELSKLKGGSNG